ncbi:hypothetical protein M3194_23500 [Paenibacillus glycanilyticus]|uniref:hypothetical protein n=1 Tax=Paenibacillus glycanilyticus TaxID=126569 RepID=UPI0020420ACB|nr:hypothetical protein [Paenibacillus glycanilyticus]MCM3630301.1 hypothetical protein [Paenibacillus glycanilyticus]
MGRYVTAILFLVISLLLGACSQAEQVEHIEAFGIETLEQNAEGLYEPTGYKKVNAITASKEDKNYMKIDMKTVEDFYDTKGAYIKTVITHSQGYQSNVLDTKDGFNRIEEIREPSTILIPDENVEQFRTDMLSEDELRQVKKHVQSFMKLVD